MTPLKLAIRKRDNSVFRIIEWNGQANTFDDFTRLYTEHQLETLRFKNEGPLVMIEDKTTGLMREGNKYRNKWFGGMPLVFIFPVGNTDMLRIIDRQVFSEEYYYFTEPRNEESPQSRPDYDRMVVNLTERLGDLADRVNYGSNDQDDESVKSDPYRKPNGYGVSEHDRDIMAALDQVGSMARRYLGEVTKHFSQPLA